MLPLIGLPAPCAFNFVLSIDARSHLGSVTYDSHCELDCRSLERKEHTMQIVQFLNWRCDHSLPGFERSLRLE